MKKTLIILLVTIGLMLIPFIATQFSDEVDWSISDFIIGGVLIFGFGILLQFLFSKLKGSKYRIPIIIGIMLIFLLIWVELAVGIFGTPLAGN